MISHCLKLVKKKKSQYIERLSESSVVEKLQGQLGLSSKIIR